MKEVLQFLKDNPTFFLATVEGDQPRVRPFGAVTEIEGRLYLITSNEKPVFQQLQENPKIEICAADANGNWLRISATAVCDQRMETRAQMLEDVPMLKQLYAVDDGKIEVLYLLNATATFHSFTSEPRTVTF